MRAVLLITVIIAAAAWAVVRHLDENAAAAKPVTSSQPSQPQQIQSVALDGGRGLPTSALRAVMVSKPGDILDPDHLAHDRTALQTVLEGRGYLAAKVDAPSVTFANGGAYVMFGIHPGAAFHFRTITLTNVSARDAGLVTIGSWDTANPERIERVRQALADGLVRQGKTAKVTVAMNTDPAASAVDVEFVVR